MSISNNLIWRVIVSFGVMVLAFLHEWDWAWLTLGIAAFQQVGDLAVLVNVLINRTPKDGGLKW